MIRLAAFRPALIGLALCPFFVFSASAQTGLDVFRAILGPGGVLDTMQQPPVNPRVPAPQPQKSAVDPQLMALQSRLNSLGFDAGPADGVMGGRTRRAIEAYQRSIGAAPTGALSPQQYAEVMDAKPAVDQVADPVVAANFQLLVGFDLPHSDYRSGMSEPALKNIGLGACQAACQGDGECQAFTFNEKARVCFLKTAAAAPVAFKGATSGIRQGAVPGVQLGTGTAPDLPPGNDVPPAPQPGGEGQFAANQEVYASGMGQSDTIRTATTKLGLLLLLRGNPELFDANPHRFLPLLPPRDARPYAADPYDNFEKLESKGEEARLMHFIETAAWAGRDEFERQDTRARFVAEQKQRVLSMVPQGEIAISMLQYVSTGEYRDGAFPLGNLNWSNGGFSEIDGLEVTAPLAYPKLWSVGEAEARAFRNLQRQEDFQPYVRTDYVIRDVLPRKGGAALDVALVRLVIVPKSAPTSVVAELAPPANAVLYGERKSEFAANGPPEIDPELFRLYAAKLQPSLLDDPAFLTGGFIVRQVMERNLVEQRDARLKTQWPAFFRASMLETKSPSAEELQFYRAKIEERLPLLGDIVQFGSVDCPQLEPTTGYSGPCSTKPTDDGPAFRLKLATVFGDNGQWHFAEARTSWRGERPGGDVLGTMLFPSGSDLPVQLAFANDPNWEDRVVDGAPAGILSMAAQFVIDDMAVKSDPLRLEVTLRPKSVIVSRPEGKQNLALIDPEDGLQLPQAGAVAFDVDILGLKLGASRDEAEKLMVARSVSLEGAKLFHSSPEEARQIFAYIAEQTTPQDTQRVDVSSLYPSGASDPRLYLYRREVERLLIDGAMVEVLNGNRLVDQTTVFYAPDAGNVVSVSRFQAFAEPVDRQALAGQITGKYGPPDYQNSAVLIWSGHRDIQRKLAQHGSSRAICGFSFSSAYMVMDRGVQPWRQEGTGATTNDNVYVPRLDGIASSCGPLLMVFIRDKELEMHLVDTAWAAEGEQAIVAADATELEQSRKEVTGGAQF
jgi:peptidoglycan hydrolase-like protein with peptidoglycan-binding domain